MCLGWYICVPLASGRVSISCSMLVVFMAKSGGDTWGLLFSSFSCNRVYTKLLYLKRNKQFENIFCQFIKQPLVILKKKKKRKERRAVAPKTSSAFVSLAGYATLFRDWLEAYSLYSVAGLSFTSPSALLLWCSWGPLGHLWCHLTSQCVCKICCEQSHAGPDEAAMYREMRSLAGYNICSFPCNYMHEIWRWCYLPKNIFNAIQ